MIRRDDLESKLNDELNKLSDTRNSIYDTMEEINQLIDNYCSFKEVTDKRPNASFKDFADDAGQGPPVSTISSSLPIPLQYENQFTYFSKSLPGQEISNSSVAVNHIFTNQTHILKRLVETRELTGEV